MSGDFIRRASYGPSSPTVGERGARTRAQILEATLELFAERGFHGTLIEDIARAAGVSRATLYQYFESKEAVFVELVDRSGGSLLRSVRAMGRLGPDAEGFGELQTWLGHWADAFDRYSVMFVQWANVNSPKAPLRPRLDRFVEAHTSVLSGRIAESGFEGCPPAVMAVVLLGVVERFNYMRHLYPSGRTDAETLATLGVICQTALFPDTPASVLREPPPSIAADTARRAPIVVAAASNLGLATIPERDPHRYDRLSPQAQRTLQSLIDAGSRVVTDHGYLGSSVDQIVDRAGVARGTFYKYFNDRLDLLVTLSDRCADRLVAMVEQLPTSVTGPDAHDGLRSWLRGFLELHRAHAGVLRAWTEGLPVDAALLAAGARVVAATTTAFAAIFEGDSRPVPVEFRSSTRALLTLLERTPDVAIGTDYEPDPADLVEAQALFIERAFLSPATTTRPDRLGSGGDRRRPGGGSDRIP